MTWGGGIWPVKVPGRSDIRTQDNSASLRFLTPGYFSTLGISVKSGRDVSETDTIDRPFVAVVSESFARRYWPDQNAIGQHFEFGLHDRTVVGVVGDVRVRGLERTSEPQVYLSSKQAPDGELFYYAPKDLAVLSAQPPEHLLPALRQIITAADAEQPISNARTMDEIVAGQTELRTVQVRILATFTAVAILLASLGIYGLLSFAVSLRQQEFGIRIALGAQRRDIFGMVLRQGTFLATAGLLPGLALAYVAARLMQNLLAGIKPEDALTFTIAAVTCMSTTLLGSVVPAFRAFRVDPTSVIRAE
jgi:predicted permease